MDELWQRYRSFWMPVLVGVGVLLVGVIVVHILTDDPDELLRQVRSRESSLKGMQVPERGVLRHLEDRLERFSADNAQWAARLNQAEGSPSQVVVAAAGEALRAALLRGASPEEARSPAALAPRFGDDAVAADLAIKRYRRLLDEHSGLLTTGDPNVASSRLLSDVWNELRVRANRADLEIGADQLGFDAIASVTRATLAGRVLNLALVARMVDAAIRSGVQAVTAIRMPTHLDAGTGQDFLREWPVTFTLVGETPALKQGLDLVTDPRAPVPLAEGATLTQPRRTRESTGGVVELNLTLSSVLVQVDAPLDLETEETR